jgi:hypothetical protein
MQKNQYLENWLQSRESWIWHIIKACTFIRSSCHNYYVPTKVWRDLLFLGLPKPKDLSIKDSPSQPTPSTSSSSTFGTKEHPLLSCSSLSICTKEKNKPPSQKLPKQLPKSSSVKQHEKLLSVKDILFRGDDELMPVKVAQKLMWQKVPVKIENDLPCFDAIEKEILWKLYEINFCYDLMVLDSKLAPLK